MNLKHPTLALVILVFALTLPPFAPLVMAQTSAVSFGAPSYDPPPPNTTVGWRFSTSTPLLLIDLGVWDGNNSVALGPSGDGLLQDHLVTIWNTTTMAVVAQVTVPAGSSGALIGGFRYSSLITAWLLLPGTYTIGSYYQSVGDHAAALNPGLLATAPGINFLGSAIETGNAFPSPDVFGSAWFGPNFRFVNAVPESGRTLSMALCSVVGLLFLRRAIARVR